MRPSISLAMIVKNEEANLGRCLASVQGLVDQIVVIDTGSSDNTVDIARSFDATIGYHAWSDSYSEARNKSLRHCTGVWILMLDADEALDAGDFGKIRRHTTDDCRDIFALKVRNYTHDGAMVTSREACVKNAGVFLEYPYYTEMSGTRLFRNIPGIHYRGRLHEEVDHCFQARAYLIDATVHHFGKLDTGRERYKASYYLKLALADLGDEPDNPTFLLNTMTQARVAKNWDIALNCAQRYLVMSPQAPATVFITAGECLQAQGHHDQAFPYFESTVRVFPDNVLALNRMSISLAALGRAGDACAVLERAIQVNPSFVSSYIIYADIERQCGDRVRAVALLTLGLERNPGEPRLLRALASHQEEVPHVE